jgi:N-acetylmuramoyl-L-alanine amidase
MPRPLLRDLRRNGRCRLRANLAGLNLTEVLEVLIDCGNMRNATDASMLTSPSFQQGAAAALTQAIERFLSRR